MTKYIKHLLSTKGRAGRGEYFLHSIADVGLLILFFFLVALFEEQFGIHTNENAALFTIFFVLIVGGISGICVMIRRFHDLGMSGWNILGTFVPIYNLYLAFILLFRKGDSRRNIYDVSEI